MTMLNQVSLMFIPLIVGCILLYGTYKKFLRMKSL